MPHKHTRREHDPSDFDLPPTQIARPLPTAPARKQTTSTKSTKAVKSTAASNGARGVKRKRDGSSVSASSIKAANDAPRAFRRLMALASGKRIRSGLDDGIAETKKAKKAKKAKAAAAAAAENDADEAAATATDTKTAAAPLSSSSTTTPAIPTIRPGERLSDFAARVDAALPLSGLVRKSVQGGGGGKDPLGLAKPFRTRQERKLHKLYDQWRLEDAKIKERQEEAQELAEEREMELDETLGVKWRLDFQQPQAATGGGGKKKKKKGGSNNHVDGDDGDMWAELNRRKGGTSTVRAGIHDVASAPPELTKINSGRFKFAQKKKAGGGAGARLAGTLAPETSVSDIPKSAGNLAEREQLQAVRKDVLSSYRKLAEGRRQRAAAAAEE